MFVAAPSLRGDLFKHAVRGCDETLRISGSLVGRDTGTGRRHDETDLTLPKQVRGHQAAAAVRCGRHHVRLPTLGISGSERAARFG